MPLQSFQNLPELNILIVDNYALVFLQPPQDKEWCN